MLGRCAEHAHCTGHATNSVTTTLLEHVQYCLFHLCARGAESARWAKPSIPSGTPQESLSALHFVQLLQTSRCVDAIRTFGAGAGLKWPACERRFAQSWSYAWQFRPRLPQLTDCDTLQIFKRPRCANGSLQAACSLFKRRLSGLATSAFVIQNLHSSNCLLLAEQQAQACRSFKAMSYIPSAAH